MFSTTKVVVIFCCLFASSVSANSDSKKLIRRSQSESSKQAAIPKEEGVGAAQTPQVSIKPHALEVSSQANLLGVTKQRTDTAGPVAEALRQAKAGFLTEKVAQESAKASTEQDIAHAKARKAGYEKELRDNKWYHVWRWSWWSNFKSDRNRWIADEASTIASSTTTKNEQQTEIDRLQGLADATHTAAETSEALEVSITSLTKQISDKIKLKDDTKQNQDDHRGQVTQEHEAVAQGFTDLIASRTNLMSEAQAEYDSLADSTHDLSKQLQELIVTETMVIDSHNETITDYTGLISQDETAIAAEQLAKSQSVNRSDAHLKTLADQKTKLDTEKSAAEASKKDAEEALEKETADGETKVQNLKDALSTSIADLGHEKTTAEGDRSTTQLTNAQSLQALKDLHNGVVNALKAQQQLNQSQTKQAGDARVQTFTVLIANLSTSIDAANTELESLTASAAAAAGSADSTSAADSTSTSGSSGTPDSCCKQCRTGCACGDSCISRLKKCHKPKGCACGDVCPTHPPTVPAVGSLLQMSQFKQPTHTLVQQIEEAKAAIRATIATHQQTIEQRQDSLATNAEDTLIEQRAKDKAILDYDDAIKKLTDSKAKSAESKALAEAAKKQTEDDLATNKAAAEKTIDEKKTSLSALIAGLLAERNTAVDNRADKVEANAAAMLALTNDHNQIITDYESEITSLEGQKTTATDNLNAIKTAHDVF